jgi:hypothetical protein
LTAARELVDSIDEGNQESARKVLDHLVRWTERRADLLSFETSPLDYPAVRFKTADDNSFWIARKTVGGDMKIELLTRTADRLPLEILKQLRKLLVGVVPADALTDRKVIQTPTATMNDEGIEQLKSAMDFALGATAGIIHVT